MRVKFRFYAFLCVFATFAHKVAQTWFVLHEIWHITLFGICYCDEVVRIENHSHMHEITSYIAILCVFATFAHKVARTWFVLHDTWHTTLFGIYYFVEVVSIENHSHLLQITCLVAILRVFKRFCQF